MLLMEVKKIEFTSQPVFQIINLIKNLKKIFISSDHAGFNLKESIKVFLKIKKYNFIDLGPKNNNNVDYPDYAHAVAKKVKKNIEDNNQKLINSKNNKSCKKGFKMQSKNNKNNKNNKTHNNNKNKKLLDSK